MSKSFVGHVVSDKNDKTIVVRVVTDKIHPIYKKRYISSKKYQVHDAKNEAKVGDEVVFVECAPISAKKKFRLEKIARTAIVEHKEEELKV